MDKYRKNRMGVSVLTLILDLVLVLALILAFILDLILALALAEVWPQCSLRSTYNSLLRLCWRSY